MFVKAIGKDLAESAPTGSVLSLCLLPLHHPLHGSLAAVRARHREGEQTQPIDGKNARGVRVSLPDFVAVDPVSSWKYVVFL